MTTPTTRTAENRWNPPAPSGHTRTSQILSADDPGDILRPPSTAAGKRLSMVGNLASDPTVTGADRALRAVLRVAVDVPGPDGSWTTKHAEYHTWMAWGDLAAGIAENLHKGDRVVIAGTVHADGAKRFLVAEGCGPDLRFAGRRDPARAGR